jgi:hypothetical protein
MAAKKLTNFRIDPDLAVGLKVVKERDGIPEAEQIRRALRVWLESRDAIKSERERTLTRRRP